MRTCGRRGRTGCSAAGLAQLASDEHGSGDPADVLPVYTRLSDAEENEAAPRGTRRASRRPSPASRAVDRHERDDPPARTAATSRSSRPSRPRRFPTRGRRACSPTSSRSRRERGSSPRTAGVLVGYGGAAVFADDDAHIMNLAVAPGRRGQGIGRELLERGAGRGRRARRTARHARGARGERCRDRALRVGRPRRRSACGRTTTARARTP